MPTPKLTTPIEFDRYYHIFNRGNNYEKLFYTNQNYLYFLKKYKEYLAEHVTTYAYCLLPNHFHLLIKTKSEKVSDQFRRFFQSYALSINKQENRTGSLFTKPFRRIAVENEDYLKYLVFYIHYNPEKHCIVDNYKNFPHSSIHALVSNSKTYPDRNDLLEFFGGQSELIEFHNFYHEEKRIQKYIIED